jgi:hypothetical protein
MKRVAMMRLQIWIAVLDMVAFLLLVPQLIGAAGRRRVLAWAGPAANWLGDLPRLDLDHVDWARGLPLLALTIALAWLTLAVPMRVRAMFTAPALVVVITPLVILSVARLTALDGRGRVASLLVGAACFFGARLLLLASAISG